MQFKYQRLEKSLESIIENAQMDFIIVGAFHQSKERVNSIYFYHKENRLENIEYDLEHTPCKKIKKNVNCVANNNAATEFPENLFFKQNNIKSYVGIPLLDKNNECSGLMLGLSSKKITDTDSVTQRFIELVPLAEIEIENYQLNNQILKYKDLFDNVSDGIVTLDLEGNVKESNKSFDEILGYSKTDWDKITIPDIVHKKDKVKSAEYFKKLITQGYYKNYVGRCITKKGTIVWLEINSTAIKDEFGNITGSRDIVRDVTQRIENNQQILKQKNLLEKTNKVALIGTWEFNLKENKLDWSEVTKIIHDVESDYVPNKQEAILFYKEGENRGRIERLFKKCIEEVKSYDEEFEIITQKGKRKIIRSIGIPECNENNECIGVYGTLQDITEARDKEEINARYHALFNSLNDAILILDKFKIIGCNKLAENLFDDLRENIIGKSPIEFSPNTQVDGSNSKNSLKKIIQKTIENRSIESFRWDFITPSGQKIDCEISMTSFEFKDEIYLQAVVKNISDKLHNEKELNILHTAVSQLSNHVMITDENGLIEYVNPAFERDKNFKLKEVIGKRANVLKSGVQSESYYKSMWSTLKKGQAFQAEITNKTKNGELLVEDLFITPIFDTNKVITNYIAIYTDLSQKQKAVNAIKELEEKEILLKEIHHRVKNNLQIVSSLLSLQSAHINDKQYVDLFTTSQQRVASIALVHEKLYESENLDVVSAKSYINDLLEKLSTTLKLNIKVKKNIQIEDFKLDLDKAVPFGLIINEIVSNSYKYAFNSDSIDPEINLKFEKNNKGNIHLEVSDNGLGIEDINKAHKNHSLGLKLIKALSRQINAEMAIDSSPNKGVKFKLNCILN